MVNRCVTDGVLTETKDYCYNMAEKIEITGIAVARKLKLRVTLWKGPAAHEQTVLESLIHFMTLTQTTPPHQKNQKKTSNC